MMLHIGCHLSCSNGYLAMGKQALALGADTFQFFTRNPRGGSVKPFDDSDADALNAVHGGASISRRFLRMRRIRSTPARRMHPFAICGSHDDGRICAACAICLMRC